MIGLLFEFLFPASEGSFKTFQYVLTGFGAGITGTRVVHLYRRRKIYSDPEKVKKYEIAEKDERNVHLRGKAALASWYVTLFALTVLSLILTISRYLVPGLLVMGTLLIHVFSLPVYIKIYDRKL